MIISGTDGAAGSCLEWLSPGRPRCGPCLLHALLCWVDGCWVRGRGAMRTRDVSPGFAVACPAGAGLWPHFLVPPACACPVRGSLFQFWLLSSPRYHPQLCVLCLLLAVCRNNMIIAPVSCRPFAWVSGSWEVFPKLWGQGPSVWQQGHRIPVCLLAGQEAECEISVCGAGEGKESLGLCVKLLNCYWLGI